MTLPGPRPFVLLLALAAGCDRPAATTPTPAAASGPAWFEDVTGRLGLKFTHDCGPLTSDYFMPQIMGSGCALFDFDGDGRLDAYLVHNGGPGGAKNQLFHQQPDGTFRDVSAGSGLDVAGYGMGVAVADVNNDGRPDVLLTEYGATRLFLNQGGGRFLEVTRAAGIDNPLWATSAAFFDFDRDGWLDLIVVNYLDYDPSIRCAGRGGKPDFCAPLPFAGSVARLYRNLGPRPGAPGVSFEDVTVKAGLGAARGKGLGVLCADFDGDGWPDVLAANDMMANHLWVNQRDGTFKEEALTRGVAYTLSGAAAANMGVAWADVDGDGLPALFVTHIEDETHTLWKQGPRGFFQDRTAAAGLAAGPRSTGFGAALVDFDRDGRPDLAFVNGGVRANRDADLSGPFWSRYAQRNRLYANEGGGHFRDISELSPALCGKPCVGRGLAVGDFDNDGAPDLLVTEAGGPARLLRNVAPANGHWLAVRAIIPKLKRDAYGAEVTVRAGGKSYWRLLNPGSSYCSSNDPRGHFGLGPSDRYDGIDVLWPDGSAETFPGGPADKPVELRQGEGKAMPRPGKK
ncbi:MAG TPA: CRTAC1 family protein [Gemmataceae bacterium]|nr:CRTAC1 family protein [Gemmataceae bacterium]